MSQVYLLAFQVKCSHDYIQVKTFSEPCKVTYAQAPQVLNYKM